MRRAFVLQLGPDTSPSEGRFVGLIEEVDTGRELRFRSTDELMAFLGECFDLAQRRDVAWKQEDRRSRGPGSDTE
jgi:hypothetical protein